MAASPTAYRKIGRRVLSTSLFVLLPAGMIITFLVIEEAIGDLKGETPLNGGLPDTVKKSIEMSIEMAKWFIGLATLLIGGVSYYLKAAAKEFRAYTGRSKVAAVGTIIFAIVSIYFGQLWITNVRIQLSNDYYDDTASSVYLPEILQFFFCVTSLCWFGLFALDRERARIIPGAVPPPPDVAG